MMFRAGISCVVLLLAAVPVLRAADSPYAVKLVDAAAPKELDESILKLLPEKAVQVSTAKGELLFELWFRKEVPAKATDAQINNGLTYREIAQTTVFGAVKIAKTITDYRKQSVKPGVYTLRLAFQPETGDHMGTAEFTEFFLMSPASDDKSPATLEAKKLHDLSTKTTGNHPCVFMLFPGKDAGDEPKLVGKAEGHWVLMYKQAVIIGDKKATMQIGLTLFGASAIAE
jgi:hypothetical protein